MRLFEAILDANHRAAAGDTTAGLRPHEFTGDLPIVALSCIDPRLNPLLPEVLGIPEEHFIWLRNAGNIITGPLSSTMRSIALACAVKGGKEIAVIGHTDCLVGKTSMLQLIDRFRALGVQRESLPANLTEYFGLFGSERQNVIKAANTIRSSPLIGPSLPVHGVLLDTANGQLEWLVNGYQTISQTHVPEAAAPQSHETGKVEIGVSLPGFDVGVLKFPEQKIGELVTKVEDWLSHIEGKATTTPEPAPQPPPPPRIPLPPRLKPKVYLRRSPLR